VSFAAITHCVASQRVFIIVVISLLTQSVNFCIHLCIRMDLREVGWEGVDFIHLTQDRDNWQAVVNMVMNLWVP
jgi:hypothetical protein